jgi:two-component system NtrC family sensor kinase
MNAIRRFFRELYSAPFHLTLVVSFTLVAAFTIGIGAWVTSRTISNYLADAMNERVARDAYLAQSIYNTNRDDVAGIAYNLANDPTITANMTAAGNGDETALQVIDARIADLLRVPALGGNLFVAILDTQGNILTARVLSATGDQTIVTSAGNWGTLSIVQDAIENTRSIAATEVIPGELLAQVGLAEQAKIHLVETPKASSTLFDPREGSAGLALVGVTPLKSKTGEIAGISLSLHLFNNDFTLVDQIKDIAKIDTATVFLGDLRVSTNVMITEGKRAVGTRLASEVGDVVLKSGQEYVGTAFVVNENYITRYEPLRDHTDRIVGSLYVGVRQASFFRLLDDVGQRITLVAIIMILFTFLLATPVARVITHPLRDLRELAQVSKRVAQGEMTVRMPVSYGGEVGQLATEFNTMLDTLHATQDHLVHSEKLASLGQLAAGVAHEINNPLGTILLYSETVVKECAEDDPHRADLNVIVSETKRCKRIVADLLNFSRQQQVVVQPTDLNAIFRELIELAPQDAKTVDIPMVSELDPHLPTIEADPQQLRQVFLNLMTNAVEAMPQGGTLTIRTRNGPTGMVTIEVQDIGHGISHEDQGKLFTPFFTTKPIGKGTGLGLAIAYGIIKMHRGQINVQSQVGKGTTFIVNLPIKLPAAEIASMLPNGSEPDKNSKILIG